MRTRGSLTAADGRLARVRGEPPRHDGGRGDGTGVSDATLVGDVDLGGGRNRYRNRSAGLLHAGAVFDLGRGGLLTSEGVLSPAGRVADPETPLGADVSRAGFAVTDTS